LHNPAWPAVECPLSPWARGIVALAEKVSNPPFVSVVTNGPNRTFALSTANDRPKPKLPDAALYLNGKNAPRAATKSVLLYLGKFGYRSIAARYMQVLSMEVN
jgi:hypothetical protein